MEGLRLIQTRPRTVQPIEVTAGPPLGMRDSLDPTTADPRKWALLQNVYPLIAGIGSSVVGRPGFAQAGAQGGAVGKRTGQLVTQFTTLSGTEYTVRIIGGQGIDTYNWSTGVWTNVVTVANLTTASITLSETAQVYAVTFNNKLVISDGVNKPFTWDGSAGAGGLTSLTNNSVLYGQPWVYYAKLFGFKNAARTTMIWSEETDPTIGYDALPYYNSWVLGQTDQNALNAGVGTNGAMFTFRSRSIGSIQGAVNADFATSGVHESVSSVVGSASPAGIVYHEGRVFFVDADMRPHVIMPGRGAIPLWPDVDETVRGLDRTYATSVQAVYHPGVALILFGLVEYGQTIPSMLLAIDPNQNPPQPVAVWRGFTFQRLGIVKNGSSVPVLMHLSNDGYAYVHGTPDGTVWTDGFNAGTQIIQHRVTPSMLGANVATDIHWNRLDLGLRATSSMSNVSVSCETPRGTSDAQSFTVSSTFARWDYGIWDTSSWSSASAGDIHTAVGLNQFGRWIRPSIVHEGSGEQFGLTQLSVSGRPYGNAPGIP